MAGTERNTRAMRTGIIALVLGGTLGCDGGDGDGGDDAALASTTEATEAGDDTTGEPSETEALTPEQAEAWQLETFEAEVLPMLSDRCAVCHGPVAAQLGLVLGPVGEVSAEAVLRGLVGRDAVVAPRSLVEPGDPEASWLRLKIIGAFEGADCYGGCGGPMPPAGDAVSEAELEALTQWIAAMEPSP